MDEAKEYFDTAASLFRTLSALLYTELTQAEIDDLAERDFLTQSKELEAGPIAEGFAGIGRYLNRRGANVRQDLAVEYARIFLGAGVSEQQLATPYESVFTSPDGLLMQDARDDVVRIYKSQGMQVDRSLNVPEDHLSFELQFLAMLCERAAAAIEQGESIESNLVLQMQFLDEHVLNWVEALAARVEACALSKFYPSVMQIVIGFSQSHKEELTELAA